MSWQVMPDGNVILKPFLGLPEWKEEVPEDAILFISADTETTGVDSSARVIEIAVQLFALDPRTFRVIGSVDAYNSLQDPGMPIPAEASAVNGITDDDVRGKSIDWALVADLISCADFAVAHYASFDVPMIDNEMLRAKVKIPQVPWVCSLHMLEWDAPARNLEVLCWAHNFYYAAHRATIDIQAMTHLLDISGRLKELYEKSKQSSYVLRAEKSPFQAKDWLKAQKYRWEDNVWTKSFDSMAAAVAAKNELSVCVYGVGGLNRATIEVVAPTMRFHRVVLGE